MTVNSDLLLERLRERVLERGGDEYCDSCNVLLTTADHEAEECTNCGASLVDDESVDEDLVDDGYGDY